MKYRWRNRSSSQLQNSRSIDDQIAICRERTDREGWTVVKMFTDYAIGGAAGIIEEQRPGVAAMPRHGSPALRKPIDRIVLKPNPVGRSVLLEVEGKLAAIIDLASGKSALNERLCVMERVKEF